MELGWSDGRPEARERGRLLVALVGGELGLDDRHEVEAELGGPRRLTQ